MPPWPRPCGRHSPSGGGEIGPRVAWTQAPGTPDPGRMRRLLLTLLLSSPTLAQLPPVLNGPERAEMAGRPLSEYPHFEFIRTVNQGEALHVAIDPTRIPRVVGVTGDLYVMEARTPAEWAADPNLVDVRGASQAWTIAPGDIQANTLLVDSGALPGTAGDSIAIGYDVVFDHDRDGLLGVGDVIDGLGAVAGIHVARDTVAPGPYAVIEGLYSGGSWLHQKIYHPFGVENFGALPLVVVSHGNGHDYLWYDHIGRHLASYGYVVMSHSNNTGPGIESASETTLTNTDHFLGNLDTIFGGILEGHVDSSKIVWIGHSRGGEGITRAYDRLFDGNFVPDNYSIDDIQLLSSIAPTVFFKKGASHPHKANYHLWVGSADSDVTGGLTSAVVQSFTLFERANGKKLAIVLQGMGHAVFHDGGGSWWAQGPCLNGPAKTHKIMLGYLLPLVEYFVEGDPAAEEFLWRPWESLAPLGKPTDESCVVVTYEYHESPDGLMVVDDFQTEPDPGVSSSGQTVAWTVSDYNEARLQDQDGTFSWNSNNPEPMNGMTRAAYPKDDAAGVTFSWTSPSWIEFTLAPEHQNLHGADFVSMRLCQGTRHPLTVAELNDVDFAVTLVDTAGVVSTIDISALSHGIVEPYQRNGGWANEFETVKLRLEDFLANGSAIDMGSIQALRLEFGGAGMSSQGWMGLDDVCFVKSGGGE